MSISRHNGYMVPKIKKEKTLKKYKCSTCGEDLLPKDAYFYVDESNFSITQNSKPYCRGCYRDKHHD